MQPPSDIGLRAGQVIHRWRERGNQVLYVSLTARNPAIVGAVARSDISVGDASWTKIQRIMYVLLGSADSRDDSTRDRECLTLDKPKDKEIEWRTLRGQ
jgi:hypothetical protein